MKFENWLRRQIDRDDPIGDLAKDYIEDALRYWRIHKKRLKLSLSHLNNLNVCSGAIEAFKDANKEYWEFIDFKKRGIKNEI